MTRIVWIPAHQRRLPDRDTAVHAELRGAFLREMMFSEKVTEYLAAELERELADDADGRA